MWSRGCVAFDGLGGFGGSGGLLPAAMTADIGHRKEGLATRPSRPLTVLTVLADLVCRHTPPNHTPPFLGDQFLSRAGAGGNCACPMRLPDPSPVLGKNRAPMGPEIISSTGAGVWRKAPMAFPDSSSVLDKFQSVIFGILIDYHVSKISSPATRI